MFIKLTESRTGKPVYINSGYIGMVKTARSEDGEISVIELVGLGTTIVKVTESAEDIVAILPKS
jgi:hypothetical protein